MLGNDDRGGWRGKEIARGAQSEQSEIPMG